MRLKNGFTLLELTLVLLLVGILSSIGLNYLKTSRQQQNFTNNQQLLKNAKISLLNFLKTNSYLPCPSENNTGYETRNNNGTCKTDQGHLPYLELGLGSNKDTYGHSILYAVNSNSKSNTTANNLRKLCASASLFAKSGTINNEVFQCPNSQEIYCLESNCNQSCDNSCSSTTLTKSTPTYAHIITPPIGTVTSKNGAITLCKENASKCDSNTSPGQTAANLLPALLVSFGKNGQATWENFGKCAGVVSTQEAYNCNGTIYFYKHPQSDQPENYFDDQFEWIDMFEAKAALGSLIYWR